MNTDYAFKPKIVCESLSKENKKKSQPQSTTLKISLFILASSIMTAYIYFSICQKSDRSYCEIKDLSSALSFLNDIRGIFN